MLTIAKSLLSFDRASRDDAVWRKTLIRRLADARVEMWCRDDDERKTETVNATAADGHFQPPLHTIAPAVSEEEPFDYSAWDRLDEQRHVMKLANAAALAAERKARRIKIFAASCAITLTAAGCGLVFFVPASGRWTTVVSSAQPGAAIAAERAPQTRAAHTLDKAESGFVQKYAAAASPAPEPKQPDVVVATPPRLKIHLNVARAAAGDLVLPFGVSWADNVTNTAVLLTGLPQSATIAGGTWLPGDIWLLDAASLDTITLKNLPADQTKLDFRVDVTRQTENVVCSIEIGVDIQSALFKRSGGSDASRPLTAAEKSAASARSKASGGADDDEHDDRPRSTPQASTQRRIDDEGGTARKSALGATVKPATPGTQASPPALRLPTSQPAWARDLVMGGFTR